MSSFTIDIRESTKTYSAFFHNVAHWAQKRDLHNGDATRQIVKLMEEVGELSEGYIKERPEQIEGSIGDIVVVLTVLCEQFKIDMLDVLWATWEEIKDGTGKTVNGVFVKDEKENS